jgi:N-acylneuraminate cytidylyltransferase
MNLCVIPARGGSKRIPRKNIRVFAGKPMIAYAIQAAQRSGLFGRIVVSTDDEEVAKISREIGAEVPFLRPNEISDDHTPTVPVIAHAIRELEANGKNLRYVCCIYPCVPFIEETDLKKTLSLLEQGNSEYSFPVAEYPSPIQRALKLGLGNQVSPFYPKFELSRTQDLERAYHDVGQFYWGSKKAWLTNPKIHAHSLGCVIPSWRVADIDNPEDWLRAEKLYKIFSETKKTSEETI